MKHLGHIKIQDNEIIFVYYEFPGPEKDNYSGKNMPYFDYYGYHKAMEKYEASKQEIEVSNVYCWSESKIWIFTSQYYNELDGKNVIDNQPCRAKIENNLATITKII